MRTPISYIGRIWGNGEFGIAREREFMSGRSIDPIPKHDREWNASMLRVHGLRECIRYAESKELAENSVHSGNAGAIEETRTDIEPLESPLLANSHKAPRGQKGISRYGGKLVRNAAYTMQQETNKSRLTFLTLTLPNISEMEAVNCATNWSDIVRIFCQRLKRFLRSRRLPGEIVGVTEVQEKRAQLTGVFALHLHMVFVGRKPRHGWEVTPKDVKKWWQDALDKYLYNPSSHYDWRAVENLQRVEKDVSSYLGKYLTKGMKSVQKLRALFPNIVFPTGWYICTNSLRNKVKSSQIRVSGELGRVLADICESRDEDFIAYAKRVDISVSSGEQISIGWSGRMTREGRIIFWNYVKEQRENAK